MSRDVEMGGTGTQNANGNVAGQPSDNSPATTANSAVVRSSSTTLAEQGTNASTPPSGAKDPIKDAIDACTKLFEVLTKVNNVLENMAAVVSWLTIIITLVVGVVAIFTAESKLTRVQTGTATAVLSFLLTSVNTFDFFRCTPTARRYATLCVELEPLVRSLKVLSEKSGQSFRDIQAPVAIQLFRQNVADAKLPMLDGFSLTGVLRWLGKLDDISSMSLEKPVLFAPALYRGYCMNYLEKLTTSSLGLKLSEDQPFVIYLAANEEELKEQRRCYDNFLTTLKEEHKILMQESSNHRTYCQWKQKHKAEPTNFDVVRTTTSLNDDCLHLGDESTGRSEIDANLLYFSTMLVEWVAKHPTFEVQSWTHFRKALTNLEVLNPLLPYNGLVAQTLYHGYNMNYLKKLMTSSLGFRLSEDQPFVLYLAADEKELKEQRDSYDDSLTTLKKEHKIYMLESSNHRTYCQWKQKDKAEPTNFDVVRTIMSLYDCPHSRDESIEANLICFSTLLREWVTQHPTFELQSWTQFQRALNNLDVLEPLQNDLHGAGLVAQTKLPLKWLFK